MFCKDTFSSYVICESLLKLINMYKVLILGVIVRESMILICTSKSWQTKSVGQGDYGFL